MSALGQKRTYAVQQLMSALLSIATAKADSCEKAMSALPPKADGSEKQMSALCVGLDFVGV